MQATAYLACSAGSRGCAAAMAALAAASPCFAASSPASKNACLGAGVKLWQQA